MSNACVLLANGFEEIEAVTVIDVLRRAEIDVTVLGVEGVEVDGAHGIKIEADATLADRGEAAWDLVVLPGGMPGAATLRDDAAVQALVKKQVAAGGKVAAICAAPMALGKAGVLAGKRATSYPGFEKHLTGADLQTAPVVRDGDIVTSRGPGTAMAFAFELVTLLEGADKAVALKKQMLVDSESRS